MWIIREDNYLKACGRAAMVVVCTLFFISEAHCAHGMSFEDIEHVNSAVNLDMDTVSLHIIDKTGKSYHITLQKGVAYKFKTLTITAQRILKNRIQDPDDILVYLSISEFGDVIFENWISAANPSVNMLEHPVYLVHINHF